MSIPLIAEDSSLQDGFTSDLRCPTVHAVVVTYHPAPDALVAVLNSLYGQVGRIELIDNTPSGALDSVISEAIRGFESGRVAVRRLGGNLGIARAQNVGIECALQGGARYVMLSDQDTVFPQGCVEVLTACLAGADQRGERVAAVGPAYVNVNAEGQPPMFLGFGRGWTSRQYEQAGCVEASGIIASGMLIDVRALKEIGGMNDDLFIDWVDFEWCWRAIAAGYKVLGCFDTVISHRLGDAEVRIGRASFSVRSPIRTYFIARNGIYLGFRSTVLPILPSITVAYRALKWSVAACVLGRPRLKHLYQALRGCLHGLAGYLGPFDRPRRPGSRPARRGGGA